MPDTTSSQSSSAGPQPPGESVHPDALSRPGQPAPTLTPELPQYAELAEAPPQGPLATIIQPVKSAAIAIGRVLSGPPVTCAPSSIAAVAGLLFLIATHLNLISLAGLPMSGAGQLAMLLSSAGGVVVGVVLVVFRHRLPEAGLHLAIATGTISVGSSITLHYDVAIAMACASYLMALVLCAAFFSWQGALSHTALGCAVLLASLLAHGPGMLRPAIIMAAMLAVTTVMVGVLARLSQVITIDRETALLNRQGFDAAVRHAVRGNTHPAGWFVAVWCIKTGSGDIRLSGDPKTRQMIRTWRKVLPGKIRLGRLGMHCFGMLIPAPHSSTMAGTESFDLPGEATSADDVPGVYQYVTKVLDHIPGADFRSSLTRVRPSDTVDSILQRADRNLAHAAAADAQPEVSLDPPSDLSDSLFAALSKEIITVHFQPLIDLQHPGRVIGVEALARWTEPDGRRVTPSEFIPVAESAGLIRDLGRLIVRQAAERTVEICDRTGHDLMLFVNTSGFELNDDGFVPCLIQTLQHAGLPPDRLVVEVTESAVTSDSHRATSALAALREHGVHVAIDDFGTGYSSLSRLHNLPVDFLKLDRSFVQDITQAKCSPLLSAIAAMGSALQLPIVAEGVEDQQTAALLHNLGFSIAQGWLYQSAMTADDLATWLAGLDPEVPTG